MARLGAASRPNNHLALLNHIITLLKLVLRLKGADIAPAEAGQAVEAMNVADHVVATNKVLL